MWTQCTSVTDRRTDGRTDRIMITKTVQRIASHGKNGKDVDLYGASDEQDSEDTSNAQLRH